MPYIQYLFCEHCGDYAGLEVDPAATIQAYNKEGRENSVINNVTMMWDYIIYSCRICGNQYKYTFKDVERRVREYFSSLSQEFKEYVDETIERTQGGEETKDPPSVIASARKAATRQRIQNIYAAKE